MTNAIRQSAMFDPEQVKELEEAYHIGCEALAFALESLPETVANKHKCELARHLIEIAATGEHNPRRMSMIALARLPALKSGLG